MIEKCEEEEKRKRQERAAEALDAVQGVAAYQASKNGNPGLVAVDGSSPDSFESTGGNGALNTSFSGSSANESSLVVVDAGSSDSGFDSDGDSDGRD